jgi:hypothetical protein
MKINPIGHLVKTNPKRTQSKPISNAHKPIKGAGRKKGVRNFFWVSAAGKDIIYWKSRFRAI